VPIDRFGRKRKDFAKVSLGAEDMVAWEHISEVDELINELKKDGFQILSVEQSEDAVDYKKIKPQSKTLVIFGNEVDGVSSSLLKMSDLIAEIPLQGKKESLNVSVSVGIALYGIFG
jgi:tRNA G18 (ribose-2'-O)-methylase SpoU